MNTRPWRIEATRLPSNCTNPSADDRHRDLTLLCEAHGGLTPIAIDPAADDPTGRTLAVLLSNADFARLTTDLVDLRITERAHVRETTLNLLTGPFRLYTTAGL